LTSVNQQVNLLAGGADLLLTEKMLLDGFDGEKLDTWSKRLYDVQQRLVPEFYTEMEFCKQIVLPMIQAILGTTSLAYYYNACEQIFRYLPNHQLGWGSLPEIFVKQVVPKIRQVLRTPEYQAFLNATPDERKVRAWDELHGSAGFPGSSNIWTDYRIVMYLDHYLSIQLPAQKLATKSLEQSREQAEQALVKRLDPDLTQSVREAMQNSDYGSDPFSMPSRGRQAIDLWPFSVGEVLEVTDTARDYTGVVPGERVVVERWEVSYPNSDDDPDRRLFLSVADPLNSNRTLEVNVALWPVWLRRLSNAEYTTIISKTAKKVAKNLQVPTESLTTGKALLRQRESAARLNRIEAMNNRLFDAVKNFTDEELADFRSALNLSIRLVDEVEDVTDEEVDAAVEFLLTRRAARSTPSKGKPKIPILDPVYVVDPEPEDE
jgi:hypothetical protein